MLRLRTLSSVLLLSAAGAASAAAAYNSGNIGVAGQWFFSERTTYLHDGEFSAMNGLTFRNAGDGGLAWIQGRADGGHKTAKHGFELGENSTDSVFCDTADFINGLEGWYTTSGGVWGLRLRCRGDGTPEYGLIKMLGKRNGTYKSIKCSNQDVSWGFFGGEGPYLMKVGLICDPYPTW